MGYSLPSFRNPNSMKSFTAQILSPDIIKTVKKNQDKLKLAILFIYDKDKTLNYKIMKYISSCLFSGKKGHYYWMNPNPFDKPWADMELYPNIFDFLFIEKFPKYKKLYFNHKHEEGENLSNILHKESGDEKSFKKKQEKLNIEFIYFLEALITNFYIMKYISPQEFKKNQRALNCFAFAKHPSTIEITSDSFYDREAHAPLIFNWNLRVNPDYRPNYSILVSYLNNPVFTKYKHEHFDCITYEQLPD